MYVGGPMTVLEIELIWKRELLCKYCLNSYSIWSKINCKTKPLLSYIVREAPTGKSSKRSAKHDVSMTTGERGLDKRTVASLMIIRHLGTMHRRERYNYYNLYISFSFKGRVSWPLNCSNTKPWTSSSLRFPILYNEPVPLCFTSGQFASPFKIVIFFVERINN